MMIASAFRSAAVAAAALAVSFVQGAKADELPPEPADYKMEEFRSPTPATLHGARVATTQEAERLWREKAAVFVDTMPRDVRPPGLPPGTVWRDKPRDDIPGSAWLVNVGYGALSSEMSAYFKAALAALSGGDPGKPLVFYCRAECWMSWNAAKRAIGWGYRAVAWYPEGSDGWESAGLEFERATPYQPPSAAPSQ